LHETLTIKAVGVFFVRALQGPKGVERPGWDMPHLLIASMILLHICIALRYYRRGWHVAATFNLSCVTLLVYLLVVGR